MHANELKVTEARLGDWRTASQVWDASSNSPRVKAINKGEQSLLGGRATMVNKYTESRIYTSSLSSIFGC